MTRRRITPGEQALWRRAVRNVTPLSRNAAGQPEQIKRSGTPTGVPAQKPPSIAPRAHETRKPLRQDPFAAGDPKADRLVRRGRKAIDATFDLHGHTQVTARAALYGFLLEARARGYGCVLIITGKGASSGHPGRGVLRARFKDWLSEDAFRQHIVRASAAHPRHGGGGAYYVFLKTSTRK